MAVQYLRVTHISGATASLSLNDILDFRDPDFRVTNNLPSYLAFGESVDLPLTSSVLLSFLHGTIRGFLEAGLVSASVVSAEGSEGGASFEEYAYDGDGNPITITVYETSSKDRKVFEESFTYDGAGVVQTSTRTTFDVNENPTQVISCTYSYDAFGNVSSIDCVEA